jgi:hypothetical protein
LQSLLLLAKFEEARFEALSATRRKEATSAGHRERLEGDQEELAAQAPGVRQLVHAMNQALEREEKVRRHESPGRFSAQFGSA